MTNSNQDRAPAKATLPSLSGSGIKVGPTEFNCLSNTARQRLVEQKKAEIDAAEEKAITATMSERNCDRSEAEKIVRSCGDRPLCFKLPNNKKSHTKKRRAKKPHR